MEIVSSALDVRRASEQMTLEEIEEFARSHTLSEICSPTTPIEPTGVWKSCKISDKVITYRNLLGVSVSFFVCASAYLSLLSLQSSLNSDAGLGLASLIVLSLAVSVGVFLSPSIISVLGTKYAILCSYGIILIYTLSNIYPSWYTLIPGSVIAGFGVGTVFWTGSYSHINTVALKSAVALKEDPKVLISLFTGVFTFFYKAASFPGNTVASVIFFNNKEMGIVVQENGSCNNMEAANLDEFYVYILLSVFVAFDVLAIAIAAVFVDELGTKRMSFLRKQFFRRHFIAPTKSMVHILISLNMNLLAPMIVLCSFAISFTQGYYVKVTYGLCSGVSGFISGRMVKYVPQHFITYPVMVVYLAVLLFLVSWKPAPVHYVLFMVPATFGACEGALFCVTASLSVILFPDKREAAFSVNRFWAGLGYAIIFLYGIFFSTKVQLWLMMTHLVVGLLTYSILILKTMHRNQLFPCLAQKLQKPVMNSMEECTNQVQS